MVLNGLRYEIVALYEAFTYYGTLPFINCFLFKIYHYQRNVLYRMLCFRALDSLSDSVLQKAFTLKALDCGITFCAICHCDYNEQRLFDITMTPFIISLE